LHILFVRILVWPVEDWITFLLPQTMLKPEWAPKKRPTGIFLANRFCSPLKPESMRYFATECHEAQLQNFPLFEISMYWPITLSIPKKIVEGLSNHISPYGKIRPNGLPKRKAHWTGSRMLIYPIPTILPWIEFFDSKPGMLISPQLHWGASSTSCKLPNQNQSPILPTCNFPFWFWEIWNR